MQRLRYITSISSILLLAATRYAWADWYVNFVHITCIPQARYLAFEAKDIEGSYVLMETEFDDKKRAERLRLWKKQGYFEPTNLKFQCKLPESTYTIIANQPAPRAQGMCGGAPSITLTLLRNGKPFLKDVTFGFDCFGGPSVYRVELSDGLSGRNSRDMTVCTSPGMEQCKFLSDTYDQIDKAIPIDNKKIEEYAKKGIN